MVLGMDIVNISHIDNIEPDIGQYYRVNIILGTSKLKYSFIHIELADS